MVKEKDITNWYKTWFNSLYPQLYPHRNLQEAESQIKALTNLIQIKDSCLDIASGTGRHVKYLCDYYKNVFAIDLSSELIQIGKDQGNFDKATVKIADMRSPDFKENSFDLIANFFTGFGYFQTDQEHQELLNTWSKLLKVDGVLFIDYLNKDYVIKSLVPESVKEINNYKITETRTINVSRIEKKIFVQSEQKTETYFESVKMYESEEICLMLKNCGFKHIRLYGDFSWQPFTKESTRLIIASSNVETNFKR